MAVTTIPTAGIADGAVDTAQLADDAVTAAKAGFTAGKVLKVNHKHDFGAYNTTSSSFVDTSEFTGITPVAQNSKFLIQVMGAYTYTNADKFMSIRVQVRENSGSYATIVNGSDSATIRSGASSSDNATSQSWAYLYTPTDTSSLTALAVKLQIASDNTSGTVNLNNINYGSKDGLLTVLVTEIGA